MLTCFSSSDSVISSLSWTMTKVACISGFEEPIINWGRTDSGSRRHPDTCGPSSSAKVSVGASTAGDFGFFTLWTKRKGVLCVGDPVRAFVAVTARKQFFLKINHNLHPHSLSGQSFPLEACLRNPLSRLRLPRSRDLRQVTSKPPSPSPRK